MFATWHLGRRRYPHWRACGRNVFSQRFWYWTGNTGNTQPGGCANRHMCQWMKPDKIKSETVASESTWTDDLTDTIILELACNRSRMLMLNLKLRNRALPQICLIVPCRKLTEHSLWHESFEWWGNIKAEQDKAEESQPWTSVQSNRTKTNCTNQ